MVFGWSVDNVQSPYCVISPPLIGLFVLGHARAGKLPRSIENYVTWRLLLIYMRGVNGGRHMLSLLIWEVLQLWLINMSALTVCWKIDSEFRRYRILLMVWQQREPYNSAKCECLPRQEEKCVRGKAYWDRQNGQTLLRMLLVGPGCFQIF